MPQVENPHAPWPIAKQIAKMLDDPNEPYKESLVEELVDLVGSTETRRLVMQAKDSLTIN